MCRIIRPEQTTEEGRLQRRVLWRQVLQEVPARTGREEQGPRDAQRAQRRRAPREGRQPRGARRVGRGGGGGHLLRARRRALRTVA